MTGRIVRGVGGYYTVLSDGEEYFCIARGRFRKEGQKPLVGDQVEFDPPQREEEFGAVLQIHERTSQLLRPPIANIDLLLIVIAAGAPEPDLLLVDRLLARARLISLPAAIVINKTELDAALSVEIRQQYQCSQLPVFCVSAAENQGLECLLSHMREHISCFAGQSAVGKSSLLNALLPDANQETGDLSRIERGRHTTRYASLLPLPGGGFIADTPGFSLLELDTMPPENLKAAYPEFFPYEGKCRFEGCSHVSEPGCAVREAAEKGELSAVRLDRYGILMKELREKWSNRYR